MATCKTRLLFLFLFALLPAWAGLLAGSTSVYAQAEAPPLDAAPSITVTVRPAQLNGWRFALEAPQGVGDFVVGPAQPPLETALPGHADAATTGESSAAIEPQVADPALRAAITAAVLWHCQVMRGEAAAAVRIHPPLSLIHI